MAPDRDRDSCRNVLNGMPKTNGKMFSPVAPLAVAIVLAIAILSLGGWSSRGFSHFVSPEFWSMFGGTLAIGLGAGFFVGIMSTGGPNIENPGLTFAVTAATLVLAFALAGIIPAYLISRPKEWLLRTLIGALAVPIASMVVLELVLGVASFLRKA